MPLSIAEFVIMVIVFDHEPVDLPTITQEVSENPAFLIDPADIPGILTRLYGIGYVTQATPYSATPLGVEATQDQLDSMRDAVDYAMQGGHFFS